MPWRTVHARRSGDVSAAQIVTPNSPSARRCSSPQRPRPTSRTFTPPGSFTEDITAHVLDDLVTEKAGVHPADHQEIDEGDNSAIQDAVLRPAEATRPVADRHLDYAVATHLEERRDEPVEAAVEHQPAKALAPKGAEGAAAILDRLAGDPVADAIRDPRRGAAREIVAGRAIDPPACRRVPLVQVREQHRDVGRVVLEVGIHDDDAPAARRLEAGIGRRRLASIRLQAQEMYPPVGLPEGANDFGALVAAPVVHEYDLEGEPKALEHL